VQLWAAFIFLFGSKMNFQHVLLKQKLTETGKLETEAEKRDLKEMGGKQFLVY
jgi:hypothetical protein